MQAASSSKPERPLSHIELARVAPDVRGTPNEKFTELIRLLTIEVQGLKDTPPIRPTLQKLVQTTQFYNGACVTKDIPGAKCAMPTTIESMPSVELDAQEAFQDLLPIMKADGRAWTNLKDRLLVHLTRMEVIMNVIGNILFQVTLTYDSEQTVDTNLGFLKREVTAALEDVRVLAKNHFNSFDAVKETKFLEFRKKQGKTEYHKDIIDPTTKKAVVINGRAQTRTAKIEPQLEMLSQLLDNHHAVMESSLTSIEGLIPTISEIFVSLETGVAFVNNSPTAGPLPEITSELLMDMFMLRQAEQETPPQTIVSTVRTAQFIPSGTIYDPTNPSAIIQFDAVEEGEVPAEATPNTTTLLAALMSTPIPPTVIPPAVATIAPKPPAPRNAPSFTRKAPPAERPNPLRAVPQPISIPTPSSVPATNPATMPYAARKTPQAVQANKMALNASAAKERKGKEEKRANKEEQEKKADASSTQGEAPVPKRRIRITQSQEADSSISKKHKRQ